MNLTALWISWSSVLNIIVGSASLMMFVCVVTIAHPTLLLPISDISVKTLWYSCRPFSLIIYSISAIIRYNPAPLGVAISSVIMFSALMFVKKEFSGVLLRLSNQEYRNCNCWEYPTQKINKLLGRRLFDFDPPNFMCPFTAKRFCYC
jgi:hypothetical protein